MPRTPSEYMMKRRSNPTSFYTKGRGKHRKVIPISSSSGGHKGKGMTVASVVTPAKPTVAPPPAPKGHMAYCPIHGKNMWHDASGNCAYAKFHAGIQAAKSKPSTPISYGQSPLPIKPIATPTPVAPTPIAIAPTPPTQTPAPIKVEPPVKVEPPKPEVEPPKPKPTPKPKAPQPEVPSKITPETYGKLVIPKDGPIGRKYAPLIEWDKIQDANKPLPAGKIIYEDYGSSDAPRGMLPELREAFQENRERVAQGRNPVNILIQGPPGTGKTLVVKKFAEDVQLPYYYVPCDAGLMSKDQLLGRTTLQTNPKTGVQETVWKDGVIATAARTGGVLHIDEASLLDPEVATGLYELMDSNRSLSMQNMSGERINANPDLFIVLSCNPAELGTEGVKPLPQPFKSRVRGLYLDYPPTDTELRIVKKRVGFTDSELSISKSGAVTGTKARDMENFMRTIKDLRENSRGDLQYIPTIREAEDYGGLIKRGVSAKDATRRALLGKYVGEDRAKVVAATKYHEESAPSSTAGES